MEALGDSVVFGEAPHAGDLLLPAGQGVGEGDELREAALAELLDGEEELFGQGTALPLLAVFVAEEIAEGVHLVVDGTEGGVTREEFIAPPVLLLGEFVGSFSESSETPPMVLDVWGDGTKESQEVVLNDANDVEAVRDDTRSREVSPDESAVGVTQVDADHANALSPL